jgi:hypothetical protein
VTTTQQESGDHMSPPRPWTVNLAIGVIAARLTIWLVGQARLLAAAGAPIVLTLSIASLLLGLVTIASLLVLIALGRNWARVTFVVLALVSVPGAAIGILVPSYGVSSLVAAVTALMTAAGAVLLLLPSSNAWFSEMRPRGSGGRRQE